PCDTLVPAPVGIKHPDNVQNGEILIYPNPSNGNFTINIGQVYPDHGQVIVTDLAGRYIQRLVIPRDGRNTHEYSISPSPGIYILRWTELGIDYMRKLVVRP